MIIGRIKRFLRRIDIMEKNINCPDCNANAFHIHRVSNGKYILKCMRSDGHEREIELKEDTLADLRKT